MLLLIGSCHNLVRVFSIDISLRNWSFSKPMIASQAYRVMQFSGFIASSECVHNIMEHSGEVNKYLGWNWVTFLVMLQWVCSISDYFYNAVLENSLYFCFVFFKSWWTRIWIIGFTWNLLPCILFFRFSPKCRTIWRSISISSEFPQTVTRWKNTTFGVCCVFEGKSWIRNL